MIKNLFRMLRVKIKKDPENARESQRRWPDHKNQPYYDIEHRFTHKKGMWVE